MANLLTSNAGGPCLIVRSASKQSSYGNLQRRKAKEENLFANDGTPWNPVKEVEGRGRGGAITVLTSKDVEPYLCRSVRTGSKYGDLFIKKNSWSWERSINQILKKSEINKFLNARSCRVIWNAADAYRSQSKYVARCKNQKKGEDLRLMYWEIQGGCRNANTMQ